MLVLPVYPLVPFPVRPICCMQTDRLRICCIQTREQEVAEEKRERTLHADWRTGRRKRRKSECLVDLRSDRQIVGAEHPDPGNEQPNLVKAISSRHPLDGKHDSNKSELATFRG